MKIAVLGATGATGSVFTKLALSKGHEVIALVRDAGKLTLQDAKLKVVTGDARCAQDVVTVVTGAEAVVSCLGHVPGGPCPMMCSSKPATLPNQTPLLQRRSCLCWSLDGSCVGHVRISDGGSSDSGMAVATTTSSSSGPAGNATIFLKPKWLGCVSQPL